MCTLKEGTHSIVVSFLCHRNFPRNNKYFSFLACFAAKAVVELK